MSLRHASPGDQPATDGGSDVHRLWVMRMAASLEPDELQRQRWYRDQPISAMAGLTAKQAIESGLGPRLVRTIRHWLNDDHEQVPSSLTV